MWFAGISFEFVGPAGVPSGWLPPEASDDPALPSVARVESASPLAAHDSRLPRARMRWLWEGAEARTVGDEVVASLVRTERGRYRAQGPDTAHASDFLTCLAGPALQREGGLLLHACAVEYAGGGLVFLGPSGAGKSTAASLLGGSRLFARDGVAVFPARGRWWLAPLPGGAQPPGEMQPSAARCLPLRGALRVVQATGAPRVERREGTAACTTLMGGLRHVAVGPRDHQRLLDSAHRLVQSVPVGVLHSVLGTDLGACIGPWLQGVDDE